MKALIKRYKEEGAEGFTLIELLIVIVILGILSTVVVFAVQGITNKGQSNSCKADNASFKRLMSQYGFADLPGRFDHWGVGLLHTFPDEGSASGRVVAMPGDIVILPYCRYVQDRIDLEVREGHVVKIEGGIDAALMRDWLAEGREREDDRDPYAVSHLGWGLNPQCRWDAIALYGDAPERARAAARSFPGNFLFSTGPNSQGGGKRTTRGHYDLPMRNCTIALDGKVVVEEGRIVDSMMIVARERR